MKTGIVSTKTVATEIRCMGLAVSYRDGEWRVAIPIRVYQAIGYTHSAARSRSEDGAYYTNDRADALLTARAMRRQADTDCLPLQTLSFGDHAK